MARTREGKEERDRAICARIAQARREAGLTIAEMAELLEVIPRTVQLYESARVPWDKLVLISRLTGRPLEWLVRGDEALVGADLRETLRAELRAEHDRLLRRVEERLRRLEEEVARLREEVGALAAR